MITLFKTCSACPEQYDAYHGDFANWDQIQDVPQVGYLRLRHGHFTVDCPGVGGQTVYEASTRGDGSFDDNERHHHLRFAVDAIERWIRGEWLPPKPPEPQYQIVT
jgi:hypothetical protein